MNEIKAGDLVFDKTCYLSCFVTRLEPMGHDVSGKKIFRVYGFWAGWRRGENHSDIRDAALNGLALQNKRETYSMSSSCEVIERKSMCPMEVI